jgi:hypothetical protein
MASNKANAMIGTVVQSMGSLDEGSASPITSWLPLEKPRSITRWSGFLFVGVLSQADKPIVKKSSRHR